MTEIIDGNVIDVSPPNVGQHLRLVREAKKISVEEVATQLRFTKETIVNLEEQHWEKLHGRAYARGYFLNYLKFLGLDEAEMLIAFNLEYRVSELNLNSPHLMSTTKTKFPWMGLIFVLLATVITWFAYQQWHTTKAIESDGINTSPWQQPELTQTSEQFDAVDVSVAEPLAQTEIEQYTQLDVPAQASEIDNVGELMPYEAIEYTFDVEQVEINTEQTNIISNLENVLEDDLTTTAEIQVAEVSETKLDLLANDSCWVEVSNADAKILIYKTIKAGEPISIRGKAPLKVLLGSASNVEVKVNDIIFDTAEYSEGDVARFSVGDQS